MPQHHQLLLFTRFLPLFALIVSAGVKADLPPATVDPAVVPGTSLAAPVEHLQASISSTGYPKATGDILNQINDALQRHAPWQYLAASHGLDIDGDRVLVEIRLHPGTRREASALLAERLDLRIKAQNVPTLFDAWLPVRTITALRAQPELAHVRPARRARTLGMSADIRAGSVSSEGIAASGMDPYHALGADGGGTIIALIDAGFVGWDTRQTSGDWPSSARLRRFVVDGSNVVECPGPASCSEFDNLANGDHGTNTMEIVYDMAPGASYWVYKTGLLSEWYAALDHASDSTKHSGQRADVISVSLGAPLDGVGDGTACAPGFIEPCGSIAEASELARSRGSLVINAAGNEREDHWGGLYSGDGVSPGSGYVDTHRWTAGGGNLNQSPFCLPAGFPIQVTAHWNDWTTVNHDYDLFLFRRNVSNTAWDQVASSVLEQSSAAGQVPQEFISLTASGSSGNCSSGSNYALMVARWNAPTNRNLQIFSNIGFSNSIPERSLGFPADSAAVFTVGALNATGTFTQQSSFSSEGPVLAPGGGLPPPADFDKPDGMNFSWVSTVSEGPGNGTSEGFGGTSSATPHVAGIAAVLAQLRLEKPTQTATNAAEALHNGLARIGLDGDNDLGAADHDTVFGYGRIRLRECSSNFNITASAWHQVSLPCDRRNGNSIAQTFGTLGLGTYGSDWVISRWDPNAGSYSHLPGSASLTVGESYWLYSLNPGMGTLSGLVPDLTEAWPVETIGATGFGRPYMLASPRTFSMNWNRVRFFYNGTEHDFTQAVSDGRVRSMMWIWDPVTATYSEFNGLLSEGQIQPGQAIWVRILDDVQVRFPTTAAPSSLESIRNITHPNIDGWAVTLYLETDRDFASVRFGQHPEAVDDFDVYDAERLSPPSAAATIMVLPRSDLGTFSADYVRDFRKPAESDEWRVEIRSPGGPATLTWDDPDGALQNSSLIDETAGLSFAARRLRGQYQLQLAAGTHVLRWHYQKNATRPAEPVLLK